MHCNRTYQCSCPAYCWLLPCLLSLFRVLPLSLWLLLLPGISEADYLRWVDSLVASKFEYVVAVQTYGRNRTSTDLRLRQLAQGLDTLVERWVGLDVHMSKAQMCLRSHICEGICPR